MALSRANCALKENACTAGYRRGGRTTCYKVYRDQLNRLKRVEKFLRINTQPIFSEAFPNVMALTIWFPNQNSRFSDVDAIDLLTIQPVTSRKHEYSGKTKIMASEHNFFYLLSINLIKNNFLVSKYIIIFEYSIKNIIQNILVCFK